MPAVVVDNPLLLPKVVTASELDAVGPEQSRTVKRVVRSQRVREGAGFEVGRPFPGLVSLHEADPFILLDHLGPSLTGPEQAKGAPWHPHRGFETVTYLLDGEIAHHDTHGGGGVISAGETQWMTAGSGLLHDELPTERFYRSGGLMHGVQLWVNLPKAAKFSQPKYQGLTGPELTLLSSPDGGALIRLIAGKLGEHTGPGSTFTPITYAHVTLAPGAQVVLPWNPAFNSFVFGLTGRGFVGSGLAPVEVDDLAILKPSQLVSTGPDGNGLAEDRIVIQASPTEAFDVLVLGGAPIGEPIVHYGPFVMNSRAEIVTAIEDFQAGRLGVIPPNERHDRPYAGA